jgi:hypothetical protein
VITDSELAVMAITPIIGCSKPTAAKVRQSRGLLGLKKLKANRINISELTITRPQRP